MENTYQKLEWKERIGVTGDEYEIETSIRMGCWNGEKYEYFSVPSDETNRHYQEYLAWVAKGNTAEVIDKWPDPPEE